MLVHSLEVSTVADTLVVAGAVTPRSLRDALARIYFNVACRGWLDESRRQPLIGNLWPNRGRQQWSVIVGES